MPKFSSGMTISTEHLSPFCENLRSVATYTPCGRWNIPTKVMKCVTSSGSGDMTPKPNAMPIPHPRRRKRKKRKTSHRASKETVQKIERSLIVPQSTWVKGEDGRQLVVGDKYIRGGEREIYMNPFRKGVRIN